MTAEAVGRDRELNAIREFVASGASGPTALILEGNPGVGKTTLWRVGLEEARDRSLAVFECSPAEAESQLTFASLGDLLEEVGDGVLAALPAPQRSALSIALLREEPAGPAQDLRVVGVALASVLRELAADG